MSSDYIQIFIIFGCMAWLGALSSLTRSWGDNKKYKEQLESGLISVTKYQWRIVCYWFQVIVLVVFLVTTPFSIVAGATSAP